MAGGSSKRFAFSAAHEVTRALLRRSNYNRDEPKKLTVRFWSEAAGTMPYWQAVAGGMIKASELREQYVRVYTVALEATGRAGSALLRERPETWKTDLRGLAPLDRLRTRPDLARTGDVSSRDPRLRGRSCEQPTEIAARCIDRPWFGNSSTVSLPASPPRGGNRAGPPLDGDEDAAARTWNPITGTAPPGPPLPIASRRTEGATLAHRAHPP
ncbi:DNA sulfur modification protein DndB [Sorangium sp. So ce128]|uniref:DNA sulfur modification protein DndB n=1 Tax=Sorangium sp. So ce128 TaxID=3133281 RepID=UPI003F63D3D6